MLFKKIIQKTQMNFRLDPAVVLFVCHYMALLLTPKLRSLVQKLMRMHPVFLCKVCWAGTREYQQCFFFLLFDFFFFDMTLGVLELSQVKY